MVVVLIYFLWFQSLSKANTKPGHVFLWGSPGTGKTLLLVETLKMYLAYFKLKNVRTKVLVLVYHSFVSDNCKLIEDLKEKCLTLGKNESDMKVMTFRQACRGIVDTVSSNVQYTLSGKPCLD